MKDPNWHNSWGNFNPYTRMPKHQCDIDKFRLDLIDSIAKFKATHGQLPEKSQLFALWAMACQRSRPGWLQRARKHFAKIMAAAYARKLAKQGLSIGDVLTEARRQAQLKRNLTTIKARSDAAKAPEGKDWLTQ
jgi:hypothetical protein